MPGTIILPTFSGHVAQARNLIKTIRNTSGNIRIDLIISKDDEELFEGFRNDRYCSIKFIEDLVKQYSQVDITAIELLKGIGKFRFQSLKKILGVLFCETQLSLVLDSETNIVRDLNEMFAAGVEDTTVLYSLRDWSKIPSSLTTEVRQEVNVLLDQKNDYWFFESFNWIYDVEILKRMLTSIESRFGKEWIFRNTPLFECQLYYQYTFYNNEKYRYLRVEDLFIAHFGKSYGQKIIDRFWRSSFTFCGMIEYAAHLMSKDEYINFISDPDVTHHLRLLRHEPPLIYDVVNVARDKSPKEHYFGEAAMHRGDFTRGKIAILISGEFHSLDNILNMKNFLAGVDCDVFVATQKDSNLVPMITELLAPVGLAESDDEQCRGHQSKTMALAEGAREYAVKPGRDIGVSNMFDKLAMTYQMMKTHQSTRSGEYSIVVRIRPDIYSTSRLKDIFLDVAEHSQVDDKTIFFPNRFWSQGINDQFFFGKVEPMSTLLDGLSGSTYLSDEFLNPEFFLGKNVLARNLKPVAVNFKYILMRNQQIQIDSIQARLNDQENAFWSKTIPFPCWKDLTNYLSLNLGNIFIKNSQLNVSRIFTFRRKDIEFFYGKSLDNRFYVFTSEHKSPYLHVSQVKKLFIPFLSYMMVFGYPYSVTDVNNVTLKSYDQKNKTLLIEIEENNESNIKVKANKNTVTVTVCIPKPSFIAWGIVQMAKKFRRAMLYIIRRH